MDGDLTPREAAEALGVSVKTVQRWLREGCPCERLGSHGRGRSARVRVADLARWRAERIGLVDRSATDTAELLAQSMWATLKRDCGNGHTAPQTLRITDRQAALLYGSLWIRIARSLGVDDELPDELARLLEKARK